MRTKLIASVVGMVMLGAAVPLLAHHAFGAEFDEKKPLKLRGTVQRMEWINPHAWIHLDVKGADGTVQTWMIEGGPPNALLRRGFTKESMPVGSELIIDGYQAKDGSKRANGRDVTFADGRKLFLGSTGTGAPSDGADPSEKK